MDCVVVWWGFEIKYGAQKNYVLSLLKYRIKQLLIINNFSLQNEFLLLLYLK